MQIKTELIADISDVRLDKYLTGKLDISRENVKKILPQILVNDTTQKGSYLVQGGDVIRVDASLELEPVEWLEERGDFDSYIVYEDEDIYIIDKPRGIITHPGAGNPSGTIANFLLSIAGQRELPRAGIVHRLDKDTSGLMVIAKNLTSYDYLTKSLQEHSIERIYYCLVYGKPRLSGVIDAPIGRDAHYRLRMAIVEDGKESITHYDRLETWGEASLVKLKLETGRTHQIRVHMRSIGHSLLGDTLYKPKTLSISKDLLPIIRELKGQMLHSKEIRLIHPTKGEEVHLTTEMPEWFLSVMKKMDTSLKKG